MNTERLFLLDPYNDSHLEKITAFENENNCTDKPSDYIKNIRESISHYDYYDPNNEGGTLPYQYLVDARQGFRDIVAENNNNFLQAWRPFVIAYTPVANYLIVNLMDSNFMGYYGRYQANIVEIIDEYLSFEF